MILVTGATGQLGGAVVKQLLQSLSPDQFIVLARDEEKAKAFIDLGIQVRYADFDDIEGLEKALIGISKLLLIPSVAMNREEQNRNVIDAAVKNNVAHIFYTGVAFKDIATSKTPGLDAHFKTEAYIIEKGLTYTFLRNDLYADAIALFLGENALEKDIYLPAGNGKVPFALRREMGEAAANVLSQDGHENKIYEITGSTLYGYEDIAQVLSALTGKQLNYINADEKDFDELLAAANVDEFVRFVLCGFNADIKNGQYEILSNDLEVLLGRKPADLKLMLTEIFNL